MLITKYFPTAILILIVLSCTLKVVEPIIKEGDTDIKIDTDTSNINCASFSKLSGYDRERAETAFILYRDYLKVENYNEALVHWRLAYTLAPGSNGRVKYHFADGAAIYKHFHDLAESDVQKKLYVDTITAIYNKQIECFGDTALVNGLKAFDYYYYFPDYMDEDSVFNLFKSNFDSKGVDADYFVINPFTKLLYDRVVSERISMESGRSYAELIFKTVQKGLNNCKGAGCDTWNIINDYAPVRLESLEGIDDFYDCQYYSEKYFALYQENMDSCEIINLAYSRMLRGDCPADHPKLMEVKEAKQNKCYVPPPPVSCLRQAYDTYFEGKYKQAISIFDKCIQEFPDDETKAKYQLVVAKIYYGDLKDFTRARRYALDAASNKSSWGEPYMLIGKLYASSGPLCGPGTGWDSQVVTWPAIDKFEYAKRIDPSVANEANKLINQYRQYMPKREDLHFRRLKAGDTFRVACWIQENTIIRTAD